MTKHATCPEDRAQRTVALPDSHAHPSLPPTLREMIPSTAVADIAYDPELVANISPAGGVAWP